MGQAQRARGHIPQVASEGWWGRLWRPFWTLPLACALASILLGVALPGIEAGYRVDLPFVFPGGADGARSVLSTIASAMISVTTLVFSITMVVLQLASSQFTPRVLGGFLQSRITQVTLGAFVASFLFALVVLRSVRQDYVPAVSVSLAVALVVVAVGCFLAFIHHITTSIQVSEVLSGLGDRTVTLIRQHYPEPDDTEDPRAPWHPGPDSRSQAVLLGERHGHVTEVDLRALVHTAQQRDLTLELTVTVGDHVVAGDTIAQAWGARLDEEGESAVNRAVRTASQRSLLQDPAFGLRQLVDIGERALSPGVNDPTTAIQTLNEIHRVLRELVVRVEPSVEIADADGVVRVLHRPQRIDDLILLAVEELDFYGASSLQVPRRVDALLTDLEQQAIPRHRPRVARLREQLARQRDGRD